MEVRQKAGFLGVPTDAAWANGVTQVQLFNAAVEGILAVEFEGNEVYPTTTTTTTPQPTTTTRGPTTTTRRPTTTTQGPTTTTSTTSTTTSTTTTTTSTTTPRPPGGGGLGCLCILLLVAAMALIALAAIIFLTWACGGFVNLPLFVFGLNLAVVGIVLLIIWILLCRDCAAVFVLVDTFTWLTAALPIVAAILAGLGLIGCALGALLVAGFFGIVLAVLNLFGRLVGCTRGP